MICCIEQWHLDLYVVKYKFLSTMNTENHSFQVWDQVWHWTLYCLHESAENIPDMTGNVRDDCRAGGEQVLSFLKMPDGSLKCCMKRNIAGLFFDQGWSKII